MKNRILCAMTGLGLLLGMHSASAEWEECDLGEVRLFAGVFTPRNWLPADGRLLRVEDYGVLYSLMGTYYGGNGIVDFALPDLRGRVPVGVGQGAGLPDVEIAQRLGVPEHQLSTQNLPLNTTSVQVAKGSDETVNSSNASDNAQPLSNYQPSLGMQYLICANGYYPRRD